MEIKIFFLVLSVLFLLKNIIVFVMNFMTLRSNLPNGWSREAVYRGSRVIREYYFDQEGKYHREGGPAIERANGTKEWFLNGKHHREDGPAIELSNGHKEWYLNGELHREGGPAVEYANGDKSWWYYGERVNINSTEEFIRMIKIKAFW